MASVENLPFCGLAAPNPGNPGKAWMTSAVTAKTTTSFRRDCMSAAGTNFSNSTVSLHLSRLFKRNARLLLTLRDINLVFYRLFYTSLAENRICERYRGFHLMRHPRKAKYVEERTFSCKDRFELPKSWCSCKTIHLTVTCSTGGLQPIKMGEMFPFVYDEASIHKIRLATFSVGEKVTFIVKKMKGCSST